MSKEIKDILKTIISSGYEAYVVGGYVRDYLLGIDSKDIDISTSMPYEKLVKLFPSRHVFPEYFCIKFETGNYDISITTFRKELKYSNNKPVLIEYTSSLEEDIIRRDFTINSLYMDINGNIIDKCGGKEDIDNKIIRVIGNINDRLNEDKTRILRALRFMSIYDFDLSQDLKNFIISNKNLIKDINYNKKKEELDKIFSTKGYIKFLNFIKNNKLEETFDIKFDDIKDCNNYLDVWKSIEKSDKYLFTKKEKNFFQKN